MSGTELQKAIGQRLRKLRLDRDLTQSDIGEAIERSSEHYGRLERGENLPSIPTLKSLAQFYRLPVDVILGLQEPRRENAPEPKIQRLIDSLEDLEEKDRERYLKGFLTLIPPGRRGPR